MGSWSSLSQWFLWISSSLFRYLLYGLLHFLQSMVDLPFGQTWPFRIYFQSKSFDLVNTIPDEFGSAISRVHSFNFLAVAMIAHHPLWSALLWQVLATFLLSPWSRTPVVICDLWQVGIWFYYRTGPRTGIVGTGVVSSHIGDRGWWWGIFKLIV